MASDAIDNAVLNRLAGDSTLNALLAGGVHSYYEHYFSNFGDFTPPFVVVTLFTARDVRELRRRAWEECRYVVTVHTDIDELPISPASISTIRQVCARIDQLLDGATFSISGYTLLKSERERRYFGGMQFDEQRDEFDSFMNADYGGLYTIWAQAN
jgi:hypothetical protein